MPKVSACCTVRKTLAVSRYSLAGMQPSVQARAADLVLLDHGDLEAGRGAVERGGIAPRPAPDDDDVELFSHWRAS